jgi:uncharacterized membrane protein YedE/YeeE
VSLRHRKELFLPLIFVGGLIFGFGLAISQMARPEVVLDFLHLDDLGLLFVMGGAAATTGVGFVIARQFGSRAPLTGDSYRKRGKTFDRNVVVGGAIFGAGWGITGICPAAAYASVGIGNLPILWGILGMFVGAYAHGFWRSYRSVETNAPARAD